MRGVGIGISPVFNRSIDGYDPSAIDFFSYLPTQPDDAQKSRYNNVFISAKAGSNNLALHDRWYIRAAQHEDNAFVSLANPSSAVTTKIGAPTFAQYLGFTGGAGKALNWNWVPSTQGVNYTLNNACFWILSNTNENTLEYDIGAADGGFAVSVSAAQLRNGGSTQAFVNDITSRSVAVGNSLGLFAFVRKPGNVFQTWHNGVKIDETTTNATSLTAFTFYELALNFGGVLTLPSARQIAASGAGSGNINQVELYNTMISY